MFGAKIPGKSAKLAQIAFLQLEASLQLGCFAIVGAERDMAGIRVALRFVVTWQKNRKRALFGMDPSYCSRAGREN